MQRHLITYLLAVCLLGITFTPLSASPEDRLDPEIKKTEGLDDSISIIFENAREIDEARLRIYFITTETDPHEAQSGASLMM